MYLEKRPDLFIPFIVSKDSHQKGLKLRIYKGAWRQRNKESFYVQYWFNGKADKYSIGIILNALV
jgi:hypothetical protein